MGVVDNPFKLTVGKDGRICVSQEVVVYTREENDRIRAEFERLTSDNAKLRELVADMWFWRYECYIDSESQERQMLHIDGVIQRMRELGVEVEA